MQQHMSTTSPSALPAATQMGSATLAVASLTRSIDFYTTVLGLAVLNEPAPSGAQDAWLGAGTTPLLHLIEINPARRQPAYSTGLYHVAIRVPTREDLGRVVLNLARTEYPLGGASDHLVSEALYLDDPDGNGLEIYRDRARDQWQWDGSQVRMGTVRLDINAVVASVPDPDAPFTGMPDGTDIGHMHLRVGNIPKAEAFYVGVLGFDVVFRMPTALFISAGGYHHHLGMNTWQSSSAPPPPPDSVGLREYTIVVPDADALHHVTQRLTAAGIGYQQNDSEVVVDDPWSNTIRLVAR